MRHKQSDDENSSQRRVANEARRDRGELELGEDLVQQATRPGRQHEEITDQDERQAGKDHDQYLQAKDDENRARLRDLVGPIEADAHTVDATEGEQIVSRPPMLRA